MSTKTGHMHCKRCGYHISDDTKKCPLCGGDVVPEDKRNSVGEGFDHDLFDAYKTDKYSDENDMYYGDKGLLKDEETPKSANNVQRTNTNSGYIPPQNNTYDFRRAFGSGIGKTGKGGSFLWLIIIGIILLLMVSSSLFENVTKTVNAPESSVEIAESVAMSTPFVEFSDIIAAKAALGYDFIVPSAITQEYAFVSALVYNDNDMVDVICQDDDNQINYRVSKTLAQEELNGDYNTYSDEYSKDVDGTEVAFLAQGNDEIHVAMWTNAGYSYCMMSLEGLDEADVINMVLDTISGNSAQDTSGAAALAAYPVSPISPDYDISMLDEDKQKLYTAAYSYMMEMGFAIGFKQDGAMVDDIYYIDTGFPNMDAYKDALELVFTDDFLNTKDITEKLSSAYPVHKDINGKFCTSSGGRGSDIGYQGAVLTVDAQTNTEIQMTLTATYNYSEFENTDGKKDPSKDETKTFPIAMIKTDDGWRFSDFSITV